MTSRLKKLQIIKRARMEWRTLSSPTDFESRFKVFLGFWRCHLVHQSPSLGCWFCSSEVSELSSATVGCFSFPLETTTLEWRITFPFSM